MIVSTKTTGLWWSCASIIEVVNSRTIKTLQDGIKVPISPVVTTVISELILWTISLTFNASGYGCNLITSFFPILLTISQTFLIVFTYSSIFFVDNPWTNSGSGPVIANKT